MCIVVFDHTWSFMVIHDWAWYGNGHDHGLKSEKYLNEAYLALQMNNLQNFKSKNPDFIKIFYQFNIFTILI